MILIKAKQLDISTVATSLTDLFLSPAGETSRNNFVNSIKGAPGFDELVKAGNDPSEIPGTLIDKIVGDISNVAVQINVSYDTANKVLLLSPTVNSGAFVPLILAEFKIIQVTAPDVMPDYTNGDLVGKTIFYVVREGITLFEGSSSDEYAFDNVAGTITFNSPVNTSERLRIFYA